MCARVHDFYMYINAESLALLQRWCVCACVNAFYMYIHAKSSALLQRCGAMCAHACMVLYGAG